MGNFYTNVTVRTSDWKALLKALGDRRSYVAADEDDLVVFDEECEAQEPEVLEQLGAQLSRTLGTPALSVLNHDDDVLLVLLHEDGELTCRYDSSPGYFDGRVEPPSGIDAERLCRAFGVEDVTYVDNALREPGAFALERHAALVNALGVSDAAVGSGYNYIVRGELPAGIEEEDLLSTGGDA